jgi:uncharacterized protein (DUF433 family)
LAFGRLPIGGEGQRQMRHDRMHRDIPIMPGQPVIKGARIPLTKILKE